MRQYRVRCTAPDCTAEYGGQGEDGGAFLDLIIQHITVCHSSRLALPLPPIEEIADEPATRVLREAEVTAQARWAVTEPTPIYPERHPAVQRAYECYLIAAARVVLHPADTLLLSAAQLAYNRLDEIAPRLAMQHQAPASLVRSL